MGARAAPSRVGKVRLPAWGQGQPPRSTRLGLVLGVADTDKVAEMDVLHAVAGGADLLVHLVTAADRLVVVGTQHAAVGPAVVGGVQAIVGLRATGESGRGGRDGAHGGQTTEGHAAVGRGKNVGLGDPGRVGGIVRGAISARTLPRTGAASWPAAWRRSFDSKTNWDLPPRDAVASGLGATNSPCRDSLQGFRAKKFESVPAKAPAVSTEA